MLESSARKREAHLFIVPFTLTSSSSFSSIHTIHQQSTSPNSNTFLSTWPAKTTSETNDDYETFDQEENEQQSNLEYQHPSASRQIDHLGTRQMAENIPNTTEQRQFNNGGANSNNALTRKKTNNGRERSSASDFDLTASPKYNKSNARGGSNRAQRTTESTSGKSRQRPQPATSRAPVEQRRSDLQAVDEENLEDGSSAIFDFDDPYVNKRGDSAKKTNMSHLLNFHYLDKQRANIRGNRRGVNSHYHSHGRWMNSGQSSYRQSFSKEQFLQAK